MKKYLVSLVCLFTLIGSVNAVTIKEDGKYSVDFYKNEGLYIGNSKSHTVKFDFDDDETEVLLSDLVKPEDIVSAYEYDVWHTFASAPAITKIAKADFPSSNSMGVEAYTDLDKLVKTGTNKKIVLDALGGTLDSKDFVIFDYIKETKLDNYTPVRDGYTFIDWEFKDKFVKSVDDSFFSDRDVVVLRAVFTKNELSSTGYNYVNFDANGGKINGEDKLTIDFFYGYDSMEPMILLPYAAQKDGYDFIEWNTKKDGTGKKVTTLEMGDYYLPSDPKKYDGDFDIVRADDYSRVDITIYAIYEEKKEEVKPQTEPQKENTVTFESEDKSTTGSIEFLEKFKNSYRLEIKNVPVPEGLEDKNVRYVANINITEAGSVVKISDTKMRIRIKLPESLKQYNSMQVVYIENGQIKEEMPTKIDGDYIEFETSHLSEYGIIATNKVTNPKTLDNILVFGALLVVSTTGIVVLRKKQTN